MTLTNAGVTTLNSVTVSKLKQLTKGNAPYVKAVAVVGMKGLYKVVLRAVSMFNRRRFYMFDTLEETKNFLADY